MIGWAVETLVATSLLMVAVLLVRAPVRRMFGPGIAYALWLLPLARLILPPLGAPGPLARVIAPWVGEATASGVVMGVLNARTLPPEIARQAMARIDISTGAASANAVIVPPTFTAAAPSLAVLLGALCLAGALAFLGYHLISHALFCARLRRQALRREPLAGQRVELVVSDAVAGPLAFGVWRKFVAFPSDFDDRYDADEQALALAHELAHHARGDLIANWIALAVLALHWWNPIAWRAFRAFRADQEMACDADVLAGRDAAIRHAYGRAIVKSAHGGAVSAACHLHTINELKGRLKMLTKNKVSAARLAGGAVAVGAVALVALAATASGSQAKPQPRKVELIRFTAPAVPVALDVQAAPTPPPPGAAATAPAAPATPTPEAHRRTKIFISTSDGKTKTTTIDSAGDDDTRTVIARLLPDTKFTADEVIDRNCTDDGDGKPVVKNEKKGDKHIIVICRNRVERITADAMERAHRAQIVMLHSLAFERDAKRSALEGVRAAREGIVANRTLSDSARAAALKGIDQATAELEADAAKAK